MKSGGCVNCWPGETGLSPNDAKILAQAPEDVQDMRAVIDVDTGTDDAIALIMAVNSPELEIAGITTVGGNASLTDTTRNTLRLMSYLGRSDIPVSRGANKPIEGRFNFAYHYHGAGGLTTTLPETDVQTIEPDAPEFMRDLAADGDLTIIALGPLTNVANALGRYPDMRDGISHIYVMGGAVEVAGNITPSAEFNIHEDPRAANVVFDSGIPFTLVGLDVGNAVSFDRNGSDWQSGESDGEKLAARIIRGWFRIHPDRSRYVLCDPLTVATAIAPDAFEYRRGAVAVDEDGESVGKTRAEYGDGNASIALGVDEARARALVMGRLKT